MTRMTIPFVDLKAQYLSIKKPVDSAISEVISNSRFIHGSEVVMFEREFAAYLGAKYCIGVNSGTDALILGIRALGLQSGDEVIVPAHTFIATALGVTENRLKPVFVDMDPHDSGISIPDLRKKITLKTKAIIVVHLYGRPDKLDEIAEIIRATGRNIHLIEDACQAHGAEHKEKKAGSRGIFSTFSFYPGKNLGAYGDGGAIVTSSDELAGKFRLLREYGQKEKYVHETLGVNSRLDTIQAAVLRVKLEKLDGWNSKRRTNATYYSEKLVYLSRYIQTPKDFPDRKSVFHLFVIEADRRNELHKFLNDRGIQTLIHYPIPLHLQGAFSYLGYKKGDFPNAEKSAARILSLPMYPELTKKQIDFIVSAIGEFYER